MKGTMYFSSDLPETMNKIQHIFSDFKIVHKKVIKKCGLTKIKLSFSNS